MNGIANYSEASKKPAPRSRVYFSVSLLACPDHKPLTYEVKPRTVFEVGVSTVEEIRVTFPELPESTLDDAGSANLPDIYALLLEAGEPSQDACWSASTETWARIWNRPEEDEAWRNL